MIESCDPVRVSRGLLRSEVEVAPLPELQPTAEAVTLCLEDDEIGARGL